MKPENGRPDLDKIFTRQMLLLCAVGLGLNVLLPLAAEAAGIPLYLDSTGSILVAVLGGSLPGMLIGFLTNLVQSVRNPYSLYYGILSIMMALIAYAFSRRGWLRRLRGFWLLVLALTAFSGLGGACITRFLYDGTAGDAVAAPITLWLSGIGVPWAAAQFAASLVMNGCDKFLSVLPVYLLVRRYPAALYDKFPMSALCQPKTASSERAAQRALPVRLSLGVRITAILVAMSALIGTVSASVSLWYYRDRQLAHYREMAADTAELVGGMIDGDEVHLFLSGEAGTPAYENAKARLQLVYAHITGLRYLYVYEITPEGCRVVFDLAPENEYTNVLGALLPPDQNIAANSDAFLAGEAVAPILTGHNPGWTMTGYYPIPASSGKIVAYACADLSMEQYIRDLRLYAIQTASLILGLVLLFATFSLSVCAAKAAGADPHHSAAGAGLQGEQSRDLAEAGNLAGPPRGKDAG